MRAVEVRNLWLGELSTNGASPWTIRNYTSATDATFTTIAERRQAAAADLERAVKAAGWQQKGQRAHVARHSFATLVLESGTDIVTVS